MNCGEIETLLNMRLDGVLDEPEQSILRDHLALCPHCAALAEEYAELDQLLHASIGNVSVPFGFADSVMERIQTEPAKLVHHQKRKRHEGKKKDCYEEMIRSSLSLVSYLVVYGIYEYDKKNHEV